jgi:hypothetical protein
MRIRPSAPALVELFHCLLPETGGETRKMFGCPSGFLGGNLFIRKAWQPFQGCHSTM